MAGLYRERALDHISNPEQLNKAIVITSPLSWFALLAVSLLIVVTLVWSFVGSISETVTLNGRIVSVTGSTNAVYTDKGGIVQQFYVLAGSTIQRGQPVLRLSVNGENSDVLSDQAGIVTKLNVQIGNTVPSGKPIVYVSPGLPAGAEQVAVCYASSSNNSDDAGKIELGMEAYVSMPSTDSQTAGHMTGHVINIDRYTTSSDSMAELFSDSQVSSDISKNGAVKAVAVALVQTESPAANAMNPFLWSNAKGSSIAVNNGDSITVRIITRKVHPIDKLFKKISEIMGDNK